MDLTGLCHFQKDGKFVARADMMAAAWAIAYPHVDIKKQMAWAHAWLVSSGKKYTDMGRFLNNWMKFCEEKWIKENPEDRRAKDRREMERRAAPAPSQVVKDWEGDMSWEEMRAITIKNLGKHA